MKTCFCALALFSLVVELPADNTNSPAPFFIIGAADANRHFGEGMIVTVQVAEVSFRDTAVVVNLDQPHPNSPFTLVIPVWATNQFRNIPDLYGKQVQATGRIVNYRGQPEIILESSNQLNVVTNNSAP